MFTRRAKPIRITSVKDKSTEATNRSLIYEPARRNPLQLLRFAFQRIFCIPFSYLTIPFTQMLLIVTKW
jgi:hypothetical protein